MIRRASELLEAYPNDISSYEKYLLLVAIRFHDIGNAHGRELHELRAEQYMKELRVLLGDDSAEQRIIFMIAQAHGGTTPDGHKDKITPLPRNEPLLGKVVRPRVLAALLRFADELADERSRAVRFKPLASAIPKGSEVYHAYASALQSVLVNAPGGTVSLHFEMKRDDAKRKFGKGSTEVYLLDEIYERSLKMHYERIYCMRFLRPIVAIDKINVEIKVFGDGYLEQLATIAYKLEETGYPSGVGETVFELCPELKKHDIGDPATGENLDKFLAINRSGGRDDAETR